MKDNKFLLKEIHHRVKNNLQLLWSMLNLQIHAAKNVLKETRSRVISMGLVHLKLYQTDNESRVDFDDFGRNLLGYISSMFEEKGKTITHTLESRGVSLNLATATPLGLILNKLATNSYKHAFPARDTGTIDISLKKLDDNYFAFEYQDDGVGLPETLDKAKLDSLGIELIDSLC